MHMQALEQAFKSREHILGLLSPDVLRPSSWKAVALEKPLTLFKVWVFYVCVRVRVCVGGGSACVHVYACACTRVCMSMCL